MYSSGFPPTVGDVDVTRGGDQKFFCPVWREGDCGAGAGEGEGGGAAARVCVTLLLLQLKCTALWNLQPPCKPW